MQLQNRIIVQAAVLFQRNCHNDSNTTTSICSAFTSISFSFVPPGSSYNPTSSASRFVIISGIYHLWQTPCSCTLQLPDPPCRHQAHDTQFDQCQSKPHLPTWSVPPENRSDMTRSPKGSPIFLRYYIPRNHCFCLHTAAAQSSHTYPPLSNPSLNASELSIQWHHPSFCRHFLCPSELVGHKVSFICPFQLILFTYLEHFWQNHTNLVCSQLPTANVQQSRSPS